MVVYWEYAFAENFLLDGLLLYLALKCAKGRVRPVNLLLSAAVGGAESVCFPLFTVPTWCAYLVKIFGGLALVLIAVSKGTKKTYLVASVAFFFFTFALGGLLTAAYSFFGVEYLEGQGYYIENAPVALVLAAAGIFAVCCAKAIAYFFRYRKLKTGVVTCRLSVNGKTVEWKAFADSGNCLFYRGEPVCVTSAAGIFALFGAHPKEAGRITVSTVNGSRDSPVFRCDALEVQENGEKNIFKGIFFTTGHIPSKEYRMILHTAFLEGSRAHIDRSESVVAKDQGK